jgi:hypothetical protein
MSKVVVKLTIILFISIQIGFVSADPPKPPETSTNIHIQDVSAFQACEAGYRGGGQLDYCDKPYRANVTVQKIYCESPSSLPEGSWLNPKPDDYEDRYHGCDNFGVETVTKIFLTCGNVRNQVSGGKKELKQHLEYTNGYEITGTSKSDAAGPVIDDTAILDEMDETSDSYKTVELNSPNQYACKSGAALSDRHDRGNLEVGAAVSKLTEGDGINNQMYVSSETLEVILNAVIPSSVSRIPMMRLESRIMPAEGNPSIWRENSTSISRGIFSKFGSLSYGSNTDKNSVKGIEFPDQKSFKRRYNMTFDLRSYRQWAWRERLSQGIQNAVQRMDRNGEEKIDGGDLNNLNIGGDSYSYSSVQDMADELVSESYMSEPYGLSIDKAGNNNTYFGHDFIHTTEKIDNSNAKTFAGEDDPIKIENLSQTCEVNMADSTPQSFAGGRTLDEFNTSVNYGDPTSSNLTSFESSMSSYCDIPSSSKEIVDLDPIFWSGEQNPSSSGADNIFVSDANETFEVQVDLTDEDDLEVIEETDTDTVNVSKVTWDTASDFTQYLGEDEEEEKVKPYLNPSKVSELCEGDCNYYEINDVRSYIWSFVAVDYRYNYETTEQRTESKTLGVGYFGAYVNASEVVNNESESEMISTIVDNELLTDDPDKIDLIGSGYDDPGDNDIDYEVTYSVPTDKDEEETDYVSVTRIGWDDASEFVNYLGEDGAINEIGDKVDSEFDRERITSMSEISTSGDDITVRFDYETRDLRRWGMNDVESRLENQILFDTSKATDDPTFKSKAREKGIETFHQSSLPSWVSGFNGLAHLEGLESVDGSSSSQIDLTVEVSDWRKAEHGYIDYKYSREKKLKQTRSWRNIKDLSASSLATCLYYWEDCFGKQRQFTNSDGSTDTHKLYDTGFGPWQGGWSFRWSENETNNSINSLESSFTGQYTPNTSTDLSNILDTSYNNKFDGASGHVMSGQFPNYTLFSFRNCASGDGWINKEEPGHIYKQNEYLCPSTDYANFKYNSSEEHVQDADQTYTASSTTVYRCERNPPETPDNYNVERSSEYEARVVEGQTYVCRNYTGEYAQWYKAAKPVVSLDSNPSTTGMQVDLLCDNQAYNGCNKTSYRLKTFDPGNQPDDCSNYDYNQYNIINDTNISTQKYVCGVAKDYQGHNIYTSSSINFENQRLNVKFDYPNSQVRVNKDSKKTVIMRVTNLDDSQVNIDKMELSGIDNDAARIISSTADSLDSGEKWSGEIEIDANDLDTGIHSIEGLVTDQASGQSASDTLQVRVVEGRAEEQGVPGLTVIQITVITMIASMLYIFRP